MTTTQTTPRYSPEDHERMLETLAVDPVQSFVNLPSGLCAELRAMLRQAARDAETLDKATIEVKLSIMAVPPSLQDALMPTLTRLRDLLSEAH